jgi:hypothetical protein
MCVNIQEYQYSCYLVFYITIKSHAQILKWPTYVCMCMCVCVCLYVRTYLCVHICMYVSTVINLKVFLIFSHHSHQQKAGEDGC